MKHYIVTLHNKWKHPYFYIEDKEPCINIEHSSYETTKLELAKTIVHDFLDVPEGEMSLEEIKKQFSEPARKNPIDEKHLVAI